MTIYNFERICLDVILDHCRLIIMLVTFQSRSVSLVASFRMHLAKLATSKPERLWKVTNIIIQQSSNTFQAVIVDLHKIKSVSCSWRSHQTLQHAIMIGF